MYEARPPGADEKLGKHGKVTGLKAWEVTGLVAVKKWDFYDQTESQHHLDNRITHVGSRDGTSGVKASGRLVC